MTVAYRTPARNAGSTNRGGVAGFDHRGRLIGVVVVLMLAAGFLGLRLLQLQVFDRDRYVAWGRDQRLQTIPLEGQRGKLVDRNGEALAVSLPQPFIAVDPGLIDDPAAAAAELAPILGRDAAALEFDLVQQTRFVYLQRAATEEVAQQVRDLERPYLIVRDEPRRFHPNGATLARGVLGQVGVDNVGLSGLERQYEEALAGGDGQLVVEQSIDGRTIPDGVREVRPAEEGADISLTLERALQFEVERALTEHVEATGAKGGIIAIADPATGDILAMASVANTEEAGVVSTSYNAALTLTYEPASVMKAMTFGAVLDKGLGEPESMRLVPDHIQIYEDEFRDDEVHEPEIMTIRDILLKSSNVGTITWADELGDVVLHDYLRDFGFGAPTALEFPDEAAGILPDIGAWSGTSFATIAIGQGIAVTPIQMLAAYNVIANHGAYVAPRLVSGMTDAEGDHDVAPPSTPPRQVISVEAADQVAEMLGNVVDSGTAVAAGVPGYRVAAKTGTARKVQDGGGYLDEEGYYHYMATVAGFFPVDDPQFSMIVILDEPAEVYASRTSAPLFGQLAAWALRHFQVSPATDVLFESADPAEHQLTTTDRVGDAPR